METYTELVKLSAVKDYCSGSEGDREVMHRHGLDVSSLRKWIAAYQALGEVGLIRKKKKHYSLEFNLSVLQRMRDEELPYRQTVALFDIENSTSLATLCRYDEGGLDALSWHSGSGLHSKMAKIPSFSASN